MTLLYKWQSSILGAYNSLFSRSARSDPGSVPANEIVTPSDVSPAIDKRDRHLYEEISNLIDAGAVITPRLGSPILESPFCRHQRLKWVKYTAEQFRGSFTEVELAPLLRGASIDLPNEQYKCTKFPLAILTVPTSLPDFLSEHEKLLKMANKCKKRGYRIRLFDYNEKLDDIYAINMSKDVRQGKEMGASYKVYPDPLTPSPNYVSSVRVESIGVFDGERLVAYCWYEPCGEVLFINRLLGHGDVLQDGVMYLLFLGLIQYCMTISDIKYINYLTLNSSTKSLDEFKGQVGFEKKVVIVPTSTLVQKPPKRAIKTTSPSARLNEVRKAKREKHRTAGQSDTDLHFALSAYGSFLSSVAARGVRFGLFSDFLEAVQSQKSVHFIKHDIHYDIPTALGMAELEHRLGVKSTYFMMPQHPINETFYQHPETWRMLREIQDLGHDIGIHLDLFEIFEKHGDIVQGANKFINELREQGLNVRCANTHGNTKMWQLYHVDQRLFFHEFSYETDGWHPAWESLIGRWSWEDIDVDYWADTVVSVREKGNFMSEYIVSDNAGSLSLGRLQVWQDWDIVGDPYELSDEFIERAASHISSNTCLYLIHPQFYL